MIQQWHHILYDLNYNKSRLEFCKSANEKMGVVRWKYLRLKTMAKALVVLFFLCLLSLNYLNKKFHKTSLIYKALGSRSVREMVQPFTDTFLVNNWKTTGLSNHQVMNQELFLVIVITSLPENVYRRSIIRRSWMRYKPTKPTVVVFFTGRPELDDISKMRIESDAFGDMVLDDFDENYYALAVKSLRILKWFSMNVPNANFLVKTDDDVYISTPKLIEYLEEVNDKIRTNEHAINYMGGAVFSGRTPHTFNSLSKWYVPPDLWNEQKIEIESITKKAYSHEGYPDYLEGNFYVISGFTVPMLLNASLNLPLFHLEDIYLTGFIGSEILNIKHEQFPRIFTDSSSWPTTHYLYNKLYIQPIDIIAYHCDNQIEIITRLYEESS